MLRRDVFAAGEKVEAMTGAEGLGELVLGRREGKRRFLMGRRR